VSVIVLDTDVSSALLRDRLTDPLRVRLIGHTLAVTFVTVGELTKWTSIRSWGPQRLDTLQRFLDRVVVLPYSMAVAETWGHLQARAQRRGRPRPANDTWITACCLVRRHPLATLNLKDFEDFAQHDGLTIIGYGAAT
jgi:predicted nucleic acid-binding protein